MRKLLSIYLLSAVAAVVPAFGQAPPAPQPSPTPTPPPLPPGPLIQKAAPANAEWSVTYTYVHKPAADPDASASPSPSPTGRPGGRPGEHPTEAPNYFNKTVVITKTGDERREVTTSSRGKTVAYYSHGCRVVYEGTQGPSLEATRQGGDFQGFDWLAEKTFVGISKAQGKDCLIFQGKVKASEMELYRETDAPAASYPSAAVIDEESRLPVTLKIGEEVRTYRFGTPPTDPLVLPPDAQALIAARLKRVQQLTAPPPPP